MMVNAIRAFLCVALGAILLLGCDSNPGTAKSNHRNTDSGIGQREVSTDNTHRVTFIHTGDFHGDFVPHPNLRADSTGRPEGGLARVYTAISKIRAAHPDAVYVHSGDTISGSAEATFTRGKAIVDVVNAFGVDLFVPGNWEFGYDASRFLALFAGTRL